MLGLQWSFPSAPAILAGAAPCHTSRWCIHTSRWCPHTSRWCPLRPLLSWHWDYKHLCFLVVQRTSEKTYAVHSAAAILFCVLPCFSCHGMPDLLRLARCCRYLRLKISSGLHRVATSTDHKYPGQVGQHAALRHGNPESA